MIEIYRRILYLNLVGANWIDLREIGAVAVCAAVDCRPRQPLATSLAGTREQMPASPHQLVSKSLDAALAERQAHPLRGFVAGWLRAWGVAEPEGILADVSLAVLCIVCFFLLTAALRRLADTGKRANAAMAREKWAETKEAERLAAVKRTEAKARPKTYSQKGTNSFGGILKANGRAKLRQRQEEALRPRVAWLGKTRFTRTPDPKRVELTRCRCWFGKDCYRTGGAHKAAYAHPGDTDWFDRKVMLHVQPANEGDLSECARAFTKAGGRGDFVPTESAGVFLKAYSGLPAVFLKKIGENVLGLSAVIPKIRREQFAFAMRATDALQLVIADGDITVDDLVLEGVGGAQQSAAAAEKERKKTSVGLPPGVRAELRSLSTADLRARVAKEEALLKRDRALAFLGEEGEEAAAEQQEEDGREQAATGGGRPNGGHRLFDSAFVDKTAGTRVLIDGQQKKRV
jgi:hypothetical protein